MGSLVSSYSWSKERGEMGRGLMCSRSCHTVGVADANFREH